MSPRRSSNPGLRGASGDRGVRAVENRCLSDPSSWITPRSNEAIRKRNGSCAEFQQRDFNILVWTPGYRGGHRHSERDGHVHRGGKSFWPRSAAPVSRSRRPRKRPILLYAAVRHPGAASDGRLTIVERIHDGFLLADEDLRLRGPGRSWEPARAASRTSKWRN